MPRRNVLTEAIRVWAPLAAVSTSFTAYHDRPVAFFHEVLGKKLTDEQAEIATALVENDWVTVRSGRGIGKSFLDAGIAVWFACTRGPRARVILCAPTAVSVHEIMWRELRALYQESKIDLGGELAVLATTGLRWSDGRQIIGRTADRAEAFQGIRAPEMLVIGDESSGIEDYIFEAMIGNLSGGGKLLLTGNPTKSTGFFRESHRNPKFRSFALPTTCSPNIKAGRVVVPGLATQEFIDTAKQMWGEESPLYKIHVLGEFVEAQEGRLFPVEMLAAAETGWESALAEGALIIGIDPAGDGGDGDESGFAVRRGRKVLRIYGRRGLTAEAHLLEALGLIGEFRGSSWEPPRIVVDRDGLVGARVYSVMTGYLETHPGAFQLIGVRGSEPAKRRPHEIHNVRDEVWYSLVDAFKEGLKIPAHAQVEGDLAAIRAGDLVRGKATIIKKSALRRELGRSPDLGDALSLCAYDGPTWMSEAQRPAQSTERVGAIERLERGGGGGLDPYGGGFDPYGRG